MSRAVGNPNLGPFLQDLVRRWLAADPATRTQSGLAESVGISTAQLSDVKNKAVGVGYYTAKRLGAFFGYDDMGALERAAEEWTKKQGRKTLVTQPPRRKPQPLLRDREEWEDVVRAAQESRPYISEESFERVGRIQDSEADFPDRLSPGLVGDLAHAFFAEHTRRRRSD